jgi:hypothetical protein
MRNYIKDMRNRPTRFYSKRQEKSVAKAVSGKTTANSGATAFSKGDVRSDLFLFECKTKVTPSKSMTVHKEWIDKIAEESFAMNKPYSALVIDFGDGDNFYIINEKLFKYCKKLIEEDRK